MSAVIPPKCQVHEQMDPLGSQVQRIKFESSEGESSTSAKIFIPNTRNAYMRCKNSWLQFSVEADITGTNLPTPTQDTNLFLDPLGACAFIQKITLLQDDFPIATIDNFQKIYSILQVAQANANTAGLRSAVMGSSGNSDSQWNRLQGNRVVSVYGPTQTGSVATKITTPKMSFCLPLIGILGDANIPLTFLRSGLEIRITWTDSVQKVFYTRPYGSGATIGTITDRGAMRFSNVLWNAEITTLDDASQLEVERENGYSKKSKDRVIEWSDTLYYALTNDVDPTTLAVPTLSTEIVAGFRYKSLRSIHYANFAVTEAMSVEPVNLPHFSPDSIQYRINGVEHPKQKVETLSDIVQHTNCVNANISQSVVAGLMGKGLSSKNWRPLEAVPTQAVYKPDRCVFGFDLQSFPDIGNISGLDTTDGDVECTLEYNVTGTHTKKVTQCWVATFDCIYSIRDGTLRRSN